MGVENYTFLTQEGIQKASALILEKVTGRIQNRILDSVEGENAALVDHDHVLSAGVFTSLFGASEEALRNQLEQLGGDLDNLQNTVLSFTHFKIKVHIGDIQDVENPELNTFYFQKLESEVGEDATWKLWAYVMSSDDPNEPEVPTWIPFGEYYIDLENYWSKDPDDMEELPDALSVPNVDEIAGIDFIRKIMEEAYKDTAPDFEPDQVNAIMSYQFQDQEVGTQDILVENGVQTDIPYTSMTPPTGFKHVEHEEIDTGITVTAYWDTKYPIAVTNIPAVATLSFREADVERGTQSIEIMTAVPINVLYTEMEFPRGYEPVDTIGTGIQFVLYQDDVVVVPVKMVPDLEITGVEPENYVFDNTPKQGYTGTPVAGDYPGGFTTTYNTEDGSAPVDAGTYEVTISIPGGDPLYHGSKTMEFTISPMPVDIEVADQTSVVNRPLEEPTLQTNDPVAMNLAAFDVEDANLSVSHPNDDFPIDFQLTKSGNLVATCDDDTDMPEMSISSDGHVMLDYEENRLGGEDQVASVEVDYDPELDLSQAGEYTMTPRDATFSPGKAENYDVTYHSGTLTLTDE